MTLLWFNYIRFSYIKASTLGLIIPVRSDNVLVARFDPVFLKLLVSKVQFWIGIYNSRTRKQFQRTLSEVN